MAALLATGNLRFEYRHRTLGSPDAAWAAQASECAADQGKFWEYHDALMNNQAGGFPPDKLRKIATDVKLDMAAFGSCLDSGKYVAKVEAAAKAADDLGITSTPAFTINGKRYVPQRTFEEVAQAVGRELSK